MKPITKPKAAAPKPAPASAPTAKHFDLGKILGLALLGLSAYHTQDEAGGPKIFLDPANSSQLIAGVISVLGKHAEGR